jgi:hypothetical protein
MKKTILALTYSLGLLCLASNAFGAAVSLGSGNVNFTPYGTTNQWANLPSGYTTNYSPNLPADSSKFGLNGLYQSFQFSINGTPNSTVTNVQIGFHFSGVFDDTLAFGINNEGNVNYALTQSDYYGSGRLYNVGNGVTRTVTPWDNAIDTANMGVILNITTTGTTVNSFVYGTSVTGTYINTFNNLTNGITLGSLGLGSLDSNGTATSSSRFQVGFLNQQGWGGGTPTLNTNSFNYSVSTIYTNAIATASVPEPSTYALFGIGAIGMLMVLRRKKTA